MRFAPLLLAILLCASALSANPIQPHPLAASIFDDFNGFFSGIMEFFSLRGAAAPSCHIDAVASPPDGGRVDGAGAHECNSTVRLTAYPAFGYVLLNWTVKEGGCKIAAAAGQNAVVRLVASGNCTVEADFAKPTVKTAEENAETDDVKVTEIPGAARQQSPVPARCPKEIQEVACGQAMAKTSPLFIGSDGCPRKCRAEACASSAPIEVECSTIATVGSWTEGGCTYVCNNAPAAAQEEPASDNGTSGTAGSAATGGAGSTGGGASSTSGGSSNVNASGGGSSGGASGGTSGGSAGSSGAGGSSGGGSALLPDYTVWITADPVPCVPGRQTTGAFYIYVRNSGQAIGPAYELKEWVNGLSATTSQKPGLIPGQQVQSVARPTCQQGGTTYHAQVDPGGAIEESDEANNYASAAMQWSPGG